MVFGVMKFKRTYTKTDITFHRTSTVKDVLTFNILYQFLKSNTNVYSNVTVHVNIEKPVTKYIICTIYFHGNVY